ncbi:glycoside hydrolase family 3 N-terminal domain-containing protein [Actinomyces gaoshouyii]|uniref:Beta-N-acetylhexosaminidase n=1 Tax=Actinomyces gaoshouyii TaxID=1960083 RepID=A0A8H9H7Q8_9ACTO|nr:glycoside hydrolase family 3 N-terminal domain-containing protein [Actinomyces gaoshouyii]GGO95776.1 beta-N-acetylhexosaminidase [Actinomyces gaoshouyii]
MTSLDPRPAPAARTCSAGWKRVGRRPMLLAALLGTAGLAACGEGPSDPATAAPEHSPSDAPSPAETTSPAQEPAAAPSGTTTPDDPLAGWSLEEKVGQLLMVGVNATTPSQAAKDAVTAHHAGNIFLSGRSSASATEIGRTVSVFTGLTESSTHGAAMLVATDQEGGDVQVLSGPGFSSIPSGAEQAGQSREQLVASATAWGQELASAGVTMNLAPVADLVDIAAPTSNAPIGQWHREYGHDAATVSSQARAFAEGMRAAGVIPTFKHFPGLGRVKENTDTASGVTDSVTTRSGDPAVAIFRDAIAGGAEVIMVSSAYYSQIDAGAPAIFSSTIVTDMLRTEMGFTGVIITDDVSAAVQVQGWGAGERALKAVSAGCDLVLASADASVAAAMATALVSAAQSDPALAARIDESARRILALKSAKQGG